VLRPTSATKPNKTKGAVATRKSSTVTPTVKSTAPRKRLQRSKTDQTIKANRLIAYHRSHGVDGFVRRIANAGPMELIELERYGVNAQFIKDLAVRIGIPAARVYEMLGVPRSTVERRAAEGRDIAGAVGQAAVGMAKLLGKAQAIVDNSKAPRAKGFDVGKWFGQWIERSVPTLGGRKPIEFVSTPTGRDVLNRLLGAMESGAYQ
jgi:uncharacterized protein (DUF2384 family)